MRFNYRTLFFLFFLILYFPLASEQVVAEELSLTEKELAFIDRHPTIRFRVRPNRPPFEFEQNQKATGIAVDYVELIAERVGFKPVFVFDDQSPEQAFKVVELGQGKFDTLLYTVKTAERAKRFSFGDTYLSYPVVVISHKNSSFIGSPSDLNGKTVAVEQGFATNRWLARDYPEIQIISAPNTETALEWVDQNKADAYIGNLGIANYMIAYRGMSNLKLASPTDYGNIKYQFVAPKEWPELASIMSKGYRAISQQEHTAIQQRWFSLQILEKTDYELVWEILILALVIISGFYYWNQKLKKANTRASDAVCRLQEAQQLLADKNRVLEKLSITDHLTGLFNRQKLNEVLEAEYHRAQRYGSTFSVMLFDIDDFKLVNDNYGHPIGDKVLTEVADILQCNVRVTDTVGRWGGEEFMVICPETDIEYGAVAAEQLRACIDGFNFSGVEHLTISVGHSCYQEDDTLDTLISRTDRALYISKNNGRNQVTAS